MVEVRTEWDINKAALMSNPDQYTKMPDDIAIRCAREAKHRNRA
jgi:hypothetical protein